MKEDESQQQAAKKARRDKVMAERNNLRQQVEEKRVTRKQLEEQVRLLEEGNRERKALIKKLANPTENVNFVLNDLITLTLQFQLVDKQQARYAELSTSLMLGLSSLQNQLASDAKAGNLEDQLKKFNEQIDATKKTYLDAGDKLNKLIKARKELTPKVS